MKITPMIFFLLLISFISSCSSESKENMSPSNILVKDSVFLDKKDSVWNDGSEHTFKYDSTYQYLRGAYRISPEYLAKLSLDTKTGKISIYINENKTPQIVTVTDDVEILEVPACINLSDWNEDGYKDFSITPNCSAKYPESYIFYFDNEKECFVKQGGQGENDEKQFKLIGNTIGFITLADYGVRDTNGWLEFLNDDGSIWSKFPLDIGNTFRYIERGEFAFDDNFQPWALDSGIEIFVLRCIAQTEATYTVIVNEDKDLKKTLKKSENLIFENIEDHINGILADTNFDVNPYREYPDDNAPIVQNINKDEIEVTQVIEKKGDWVKLEDVFAEKTIRWIRWKKNGRFWINMYYSI